MSAGLGEPKPKPKPQTTFKLEPTLEVRPRLRSNPSLGLCPAAPPEAKIGHFSVLNNADMKTTFMLVQTIWNIII